MYKVIHVSCFQADYATTRDANDFVHAKRLARKKPLLAGLNVTETYISREFSK